MTRRKHFPESNSQPPAITSPPAGGKAALSINEWCAQWGVGRNTAYNEIARGELSTIKIGGRRLITAQQNAAYAARKMSQY